MKPKLKVKKEDGDNMEKTRLRPQCHRRWNNNKDQWGKLQSDIIANPKSAFKGEFTELEGEYLYFSTGHSSDMFKTSIHIISGYVARKYDNGDDIKMILNRLKIPTLEKAEALGSMAYGLDKDIYR